MNTTNYSSLNLEGHCSSTDDWADEKFHKKIENLEKDLHDIKRKIEKSLSDLEKFLNNKKEEDGSSSGSDA